MTKAVHCAEKGRWLMIKAHKIRLHPTAEQVTYFAMAAGTARYAFNWALAEWKRQYEAGEKPSALGLRTQFHALRRAQLPWTYEVTKCAIEGAFMDLAAAFNNFFEGRKAGRKTGFPRFKSKRRSQPSFYLANDKFTVGDRLPRRTQVGTGEYGGELALPGFDPLRTHLKNGCMVVCVHSSRNPRCNPLQYASSCWHRCRVEPAGNPL